MNYKKIISIFLVVASLFVTVGANSGLMCFANENHTKMEQSVHDSKVNEKADSENKAQKDSSLWSDIKFTFKSHFAAIVGIAGSMASIFAIIGGIFGAVTSYKCYVDSGSFTCSGLREFIQKYKDTIESNWPSIWKGVEFLMRHVHTVIVLSQSQD